MMPENIPSIIGITHTNGIPTAHNPVKYVINNKKDVTENNLKNNVTDELVFDKSVNPMYAFTILFKISASLFFINITPVTSPAKNSRISKYISQSEVIGLIFLLR